MITAEILRQHQILDSDEFAVYLAGVNNLYADRVLDEPLKVVSVSNDRIYLEGYDHPIRKTICTNGNAATVMPNGTRIMTLFEPEHLEIADALDGTRTTTKFTANQPVSVITERQDGSLLEEQVIRPDLPREHIDYSRIVRARTACGDTTVYEYCHDRLNAFEVRNSDDYLLHRWTRISGQWINENESGTFDDVFLDKSGNRTMYSRQHGMRNYRFDGSYTTRSASGLVLESFRRTAEHPQGTRVKFTYLKNGEIVEIAEIVEVGGTQCQRASVSVWRKVAEDSWVEMRDDETTGRSFQGSMHVQDDGTLVSTSKDGLTIIIHKSSGAKAVIDRRNNRQLTQYPSGAQTIQNLCEAPAISLNSAAPRNSIIKYSTGSSIEFDQLGRVAAIDGFAGKTTIVYEQGEMTQLIMPACTWTRLSEKKWIASNSNGRANALDIQSIVLSGGNSQSGGDIVFIADQGLSFIMRMDGSFIIDCCGIRKHTLPDGTSIDVAIDGTKVARDRLERVTSVQGLNNVIQSLVYGKSTKEKAGQLHEIHVLYGEGLIASRFINCDGQWRRMTIGPSGNLRCRDVERLSLDEFTGTLKYAINDERTIEQRADGSFVEFDNHNNRIIRCGKLNGTRQDFYYTPKGVLHRVLERDANEFVIRTVYAAPE